MPADRHQIRLLGLIFFASGFSGLIYESIWTHYLKLFLGHSAYAQVLVLGIFMGGMAAGAALSSGWSSRCRNLLAAYAVIEAGIGCFALAFHPVFVALTGAFYDFGAGGTLGATSFVLAKWALAALLILPQSVLLGATFPLFAAAVVRGRPQEAGRAIAVLYFANSLGGGIGVLLSGFVLIPAVGLPGAMTVAGVINGCVALAAWSISRPVARPLGADSGDRAGLGLVGCFLIAVSFLTGATSFVYEVAWIRMLSLVLGSATHAFELMLSAFITGLAFGGFWIRKRIDSVASPLALLGYVQLAMGCAAIVTLPLYNWSFDLVAWFVKILAKSDDGYAIFNVVRYGVAMVIMFPAAFCAGMTLPLVTRILYARPGQQERSIGVVYSANTVGAICGLAFSVMIGLPEIGLRYLVASGAIVDVLLGGAVLLVFGGVRHIRLSLAATAACCAGSVATAVTFDSEKLVSGVYRTGEARTTGRIIEIAHGRTATISSEFRGGATIIRTNGKPDASAVSGFPTRYEMDEVTMTLSAAIPLLLHDRPRSIANIGFGSGITGETLLGDPRVQSLDTIEIEPRMVDLAMYFSGRNDRMYSDPRSRIHIDDAKAYFASADRRYDLIISEPSNPWVSGVAGLFSVEFYRHVVRYMEPNGLFAQWLQVYESHPDRVASVLKAVGDAFEDYLVVAIDYGDLLIVARPRGRIDLSSFDIARLSPQIRQWLRRLDVAGQADILTRVIGDKALLSPWVEQRRVPANSDFHPYIDTHADRDRFIGKRFDLMAVALFAHPIPEAFGIRPPIPDGSMLSASEHFGSNPYALQARMVVETLLGVTDSNLLPVSTDISPESGSAAMRLIDECRAPPNGDGPGAISGVLIKVLPYVSSAEGRAVVARLEEAQCMVGLSAAQRPWAQLARNMANRDTLGYGRTAEHLLDTGQATTALQARYLLGMALLGYLAGGQPGLATLVWQKHAAAVLGDAPPSIEIELLASHLPDPVRRSAGPSNR